MTFEREWTVQFADADPFGIAHYPRIVDAIHGTSDRFMESIGHPFWEISQERGFGLPILEVNASFRQPLRAGETVTIRLTTDLGETSVRFDYEGVRDGETVFTAYEQRACVPVDGDSAMAIPEELRRALETASGDGGGARD